MTPHGFWAMARTLLDEVLGESWSDRTSVGSIVRDPNGRAYNRTSYLPERKRMMERRADVPWRLTGWDRPSCKSVRNSKLCGLVNPYWSLSEPSWNFQAFWGGFLKSLWIQSEAFRSQIDALVDLAIRKLKWCLWIVQIKDWRRIAMRYDRCAHTFFSAICIAAIVIFYL
jgi:hypothetical protein